MCHLQAVAGGDGPQLWRIAVNVLNKPVGGGSTAWLLGVGLTTHHNK
jgi:hypothetical protein